MSRRTDRQLVRYRTEHASDAAPSTDNALPKPAVADVDGTTRSLHSWRRLLTRHAELDGAVAVCERVADWDQLRDKVAVAQELGLNWMWQSDRGFGVEAMKYVPTANEAEPHGWLLVSGRHLQVSQPDHGAEPMYGTDDVATSLLDWFYEEQEVVQELVLVLGGGGGGGDGAGDQGAAVAVAQGAARLDGLHWRCYDQEGVGAVNPRTAAEPRECHELGQAGTGGPADPDTHYLVVAREDPGAVREELDLGLPDCVWRGLVRLAGGEAVQAVVEGVRGRATVEHVERVLERLKVNWRWHSPDRRTDWRHQETADRPLDWGALLLTLEDLPTFWPPPPSALELQAVAPVAGERGGAEMGQQEGRWHRVVRRCAQWRDPQEGAVAVCRRLEGWVELRERVLEARDLGLHWLWRTDDGYSWDSLQDICDKGGDRVEGYLVVAPVPLQANRLSAEAQRVAAAGEEGARVGGAAGVVEGLLGWFEAQEAVRELVVVLTLQRSLTHALSKETVQRQMTRMWYDESGNGERRLHYGRSHYLAVSKAPLALHRPEFDELMPEHLLAALTRVAGGDADAAVLEGVGGVEGVARGGGGGVKYRGEARGDLEQVVHLAQQMGLKWGWYSPEGNGAVVRVLARVPQHLVPGGHLVVTSGSLPPYWGDILQEEAAHWRACGRGVGCWGGAVREGVEGGNIVGVEEGALDVGWWRGLLERHVGREAGREVGFAVCERVTDWEALRRQAVVAEELGLRWMWHTDDGCGFGSLQDIPDYDPNASAAHPTSTCPPDGWLVVADRFLPFRHCGIRAPTATPTATATNTNRTHGNGAHVSVLEASSGGVADARAHAAAGSLLRWWQGQEDIGELVVVLEPREAGARELLQLEAGLRMLPWCMLYKRDGLQWQEPASPLNFSQQPRYMVVARRPLLPYRPELDEVIPAGITAGQLLRVARGEVEEAVVEGVREAWEMEHVSQVVQQLRLKWECYIPYVGAEELHCPVVSMDKE